MFSTLRTRFGIPGVISVIALVFAMIGGAWAANNSGGDQSKATASAKKKSKRGPRGPKGPAGPQGPQGEAGPKGDKGDAGSNGQNGNDGNNGNDGVDGKSVTTGAALPSECPVVGGSTVEVEGVPASKKAICNGEDGDPWSVGGVLPSEETLTGTWGGFFGPTGVQFPISFPLPVEPAPEPIYVTGASASGCPGVISGVPEADPGKLCVYSGPEFGDLEAGFDPPLFVKPTLPEELGAISTGTLMFTLCEEPQCQRTGTWAVTAE
jgi:hypothetical protein